MNHDCSLRGEQNLPVDGVLHLFQVTDTHLMAESGGRLLNVDTDDSLAAVLDLAKRRSPGPDAMLITGDIAGDGAVGAYERMEAGLAPFGVPSFWLPGNHDGCAAAAVPEERFTRTITTPHWLIVMLNSQVEDEVGGRLDAVELDALSAAVDGANAARRHLLVALHHPLHKLGVAWLDPQRVENADAFFAEIGRCQQSAYVISGHVHQESDLVYEGVRYLTTPSTCIQFAPNQVDFKVDDIAPGYRWLDLHPDGSIETAVERVTYRSFPVDLASGGYL